MQRAADGAGRALGIAGRHPVMGKLGGGDVDPGDLSPALELAAECRVESITLADQEAVVRDLGEQGMPECIATRSPVRIDHLDEDRARERGSQRVGDGGLRSLEHRGDERIVDAAAGGGCRPKDIARGLGQVRHPSAKDIAEALRQPPPRRTSRRELLDEERVSPAPLDDRFERLAGRRRRVDRPNERQHLGSPERLEFDPIDPVVEVELCEPSRDGAPRVQLIGPDRHDEQHRGLAEVPGQERGEGEGVLVSPLDVLDHDEDGAVAGETLDHGKDRLEEPARAAAIPFSGGCHAPATRKLGKQSRDLVARGSEKPGDATRIHGSSQPPQPLDVGRVRGGSAGGR